MKWQVTRVATLIVAQLLFLAVPARSAEEFYKGKTLMFVVGYGPGAGYDVYMRILARHIGQHIPGNPTVVPQNMPGAGSLVMINYIYNVAPRDGTVIGLSPADLLLEPLFGNANAKFDAQKFNWIGSPTRDPVATCITWHDSPIKTMEGAMKREVLLAALGPGTASAFYPQILNATIGTKFKILLGYADSGAASVAMENREVDGICGLSTANFRATHPDWLNKNQVNVIGVFTERRSPDLPEVRSVYEYANDELSRQVLDLAFAINSVDRPVMTPPDVPADRLAILRAAFDATVKDPEYIAEVSRSNLDLSPVSGTEIGPVLAKLYAMPTNIVKKVVSIRPAQ